jgi:Tfp pilus assembly protein FimT
MISRNISRNVDAARRGFSLVELIYVCCLIGLLAAIAVPRIDFQRVRVDSAALQVTSQLLLAQRLAVMNQHDVRVSFDNASYALVVHQDANNNGAVDSGEQTRTETLGEGVQFDVAGSVLYGTGDALTFEEDAAGPRVAPTRTGRCV